MPTQNYEKFEKLLQSADYDESTCGGISSITHLVQHRRVKRRCIPLIAIQPLQVQWLVLAPLLLKAAATTAAMAQGMPQAICNSDYSINACAETQLFIDGNSDTPLKVWSNVQQLHQ